MFVESNNVSEEAAASIFRSEVSRTGKKVVMRESLCWEETLSGQIGVRGLEIGIGAII